MAIKAMLKFSVKPNYIRNTHVRNQDQIGEQRASEIVTYGMVNKSDSTVQQIRKNKREKITIRIAKSNQNPIRN